MALTIPRYLWVIVSWNLSVLLILQVCPVRGWNAEGRLLKALFANYSRQARPVSDVTKSVHVEISVTLREVIELDEQQEILRSVVWILQVWTDEFLTWDPALYDGVDSLTVSAAEIWTPDMYIYNLVGEATNRAATVRGLAREELVIYPNGRVLDYMPLQLDTRCNPDLIFFPFDVQTCVIKLVPWASMDKSMKMYPSEENQSMYRGANGAWLEITINLTSFTNYSLGGNWTYTSISAHVTMKRNPLFYLLNLVIPVFCMGLVMLLSLLLPVESEERLTVGLTAFLTYSLFSLVLSDIIPPSANPPPVLCAFLGLNMILTLVIIAWNVFAIRIHHTAPTWQIEIGNRGIAPDSSRDVDQQGNAIITNGDILQHPAKLESNKAMKNWKRVSNIGDKSLACIFSLILFTEFSFFAFLALTHV